MPNTFDAEPHLVKFPDDYEPIAQLFEGTLNVIYCKACKEKIGTLKPLLVFERSKKCTVVCINPIYREKLNKIIDTIPAIKDEKWDIVFKDDYVEVYYAVVPWLNEMVLPIFNSIMSGDFSNKPFSQQLAVCTPLFLRIFKSQAYGTAIENMFRGSNKDLIKDLYSATIQIHLHNILKNSIQKKILPDLYNEFEKRLPTSCITDDTLRYTVENCINLTNENINFTLFRKGFIAEYMNAILHAQSNVKNPRSEHWASMLILLWNLMHSKNIELDTQFDIPAETIHKITNFQDLWNLTMTKKGDNPEGFEQQLKEIEKMIDRFGFRKEFENIFKSPVIKITYPEKLDPVPDNLFADAFLQAFFKRLKFNKSYQISKSMGGIAGGMVDTCLANGLEKSAKTAAIQLIQKALDVEDYCALASMGSRIIQKYNKYGKYALAAEIVSKIKPILQDKDIFNKVIIYDPALIIDFINEIANALRYIHQYDVALKFYDMAYDMNEIKPDLNGYKYRRDILEKNKAIIYRSQGQFSKARKMYLSLHERSPDDPDLLYSLSIFEVTTCRFEKALEYIDKVIELTFNSLDKEMHAEYLLCKGYILFRIGKTDGGLKLLMNAEQILENSLSWVRIRIASLALTFSPDTQLEKDFIDRCEKLIRTQIIEGTCRNNPSLVTIMAVQLGEKLLKEGRASELQEILKDTFAWYDKEEAAHPWQYYHLRGRIAKELGNREECRMHFTHAKNAFEVDVPEGQEGSFALTWIKDKDDFLKEITSELTNMVLRKEIHNNELLGIYEIANGREIGARLKVNMLPSDIIQQIKEKSHRRERNIHVFFPLVYDDTMYLCHHSADNKETHLLDSLKWDQQQVLKIQKYTERAMNMANPANLSALDKSLLLWNEFAQTLGKTISSLVDDNSHICFLPGKELTGLPLHLALSQDGRFIIETNTVSYAPNFATLLAGPVEKTEFKEGLCVIAVSKSGDSEEFRKNMMNTVEGVKSVFHISYLLEKEADLEKIKRVLPSVYEVAFLCHGTYGGSELGNCICIAHKNCLPPSLLPINEIPDLERFLLSWQNFEAIKQTPSIFFTLACSSGKTMVTLGGARYGLEQTLFSSGTRSLISPLWDVSQEPALAWFSEYNNNRTMNNELLIEDIYQKTMNSIREKYHNPFFWGAFTLNGSLFWEA